MISRAREGDLATIVRLETDAFAGQAWSIDQWLEEIRSDDRAVFVARQSGQVVAVATFNCVAEDAELYRVIVDAPHRGQGCGRELVRAGICWAVSRGAKRMLLEVSATNERALRLYQRLGFSQISRRADYYRPGDDALILVLPLVKEEEPCVNR